MNETVEFTNLCMVRDSDRVLVMDRKKEDWPGITFPGGHVEAGESFTEAVIREVKEETGLRIASPQICGMKDWVEDGIRYVVLFYKTEKFEGDLISSEEAVSYTHLDVYKRQGQRIVMWRACSTTRNDSIAGWPPIPIIGWIIR